MFLKWIKKNKLKILATGICSIAMALFTFISFSCKTYAFTIDNNGNLIGDNLCNDNWSYNNSGNYSQYNNIHDYDINSMININGEYTFSIYYNQNINNMLAIELRRNYGYAHSVGSSNLEGRLSLTFNFNTNDIVQIRVYSTYGTTANKSVQFYNAMLNEGDTAQEWEPYGIYYSEANYNNIQEQYNGLYEAQQNNNLYYAFNNAEAKLYNAMLNTPYENQTPIVSGTITLNQDDYYINAYSSQEISNYLNTYDSDTWTIFYYTIMYIPNMNFNNTFIVNVGDLTNDYNLTCYYTDGTSEKYNPRDLEDYVMIANKERKNIKYITIDIYMPDYVSFELQLSIDGTSYSTGYAQGYNNGYINGNNIGTNTAYENGKNYANANVNKNSASYKAGYSQGKSDGLDISNNPNNSLYGMVIRS